VGAAAGVGHHRAGGERGAAAIADAVDYPRCTAGEGGVGGRGSRAAAAAATVPAAVPVAGLSPSPADAATSLAGGGGGGAATTAADGDREDLRAVPGE